MLRGEEPGWSEFEEFYRRSFDGVAGAVYLLLGDREEAFDVTQESFVRTWLAWARVSKYERPVAFTFRVAANLARSRLRRLATFRRLLPLVGGHGPETVEEADVVTRLSVEEALRHLPARQRLAVVLCDLTGLTSEEAARVLHARASTIRVHLARARAALRALLSEAEVATPEDPDRPSGPLGRKTTGGEP